MSLRIQNTDPGPVSLCLGPRSVFRIRIRIPYPYPYSVSASVGQGSVFRIRIRIPYPRLGHGSVFRIRIRIPYCCHTNANADTEHEISPNTKHHIFQYEYGYGYGIRMPAHSQANTDLTQNTDPTQYGA